MQNSLISLSEKIEMLDGVRHILSDQGSWIQSVSARNAERDIVHPTSDEATCWCLTGAIEYVNGSDDSIFDELYNEIKKHLPEGYRNVVHFNDHELTHHKDVLSLIDVAIVDLQQREDMEQ